MKGIRCIRDYQRLAKFKDVWYFFSDFCGSLRVCKQLKTTSKISPSIRGANETLNKNGVFKTCNRTNLAPKTARSRSISRFNSTFTHRLSLGSNKRRASYGRLTMIPRKINQISKFQASHGPKNPGSLTFHESSWLFNRDPYNGFFLIPISLGSIIPYIP